MALMPRPSPYSARALAVVCSLWVVNCGSLGWAQETPTPLEALFASADEELASSQLGEAFTNYDAALALAVADGLRLAQGRALMGMGAAAAANDVASAEGYFNRALELFQADKEYAWAGVAMYQLGTLEGARGREAKAAELYSGALQHFDRTKSDTPGIAKWQAAAMVALGKSLLGNDPELAATRFDKAAALYNKQGETLLEADAYYQKGRAEWERNRLDRASKALETALQKYREGDDQKWEAATQTALGQLRIAQGQFDDARSRFNRAVRQYERLENVEPFELLARYGLAEAQRELLHFDKAIDEYTAAFTLAERLESPEWKVVLTVGLGRALTYSGDQDAGKLKLDEALQLLGEEGNSKQRALCNLVLGDIYLAQNDGTSARANFESAQSIAAALEDPTVLLLADVGLGEVLMVDKEFDQAKVKLEAVLERVDKDDLSVRARASLALARIAQEQNDSRAAHSYYDDAIKLYKTPDSRLARGRALVANAQLYAKEQDERHARNDLTDAIEIFVEVNAQREQAEARALLGSNLANSKKAQPAITEYAKASDLFATLQMPTEAGRARLAVAKLFLADGDVEDTITSLLLAVEQFDAAAGELPQNSEALLLLGQLQFEQGQKVDARTTLERAYELAKKLSLNREQANALLFMGELHEEAGEVSDALKAFEEAGTLLVDLNDDDGLGRARFGMGRMYVATNDPRAREVLEEAKRLFRQAGSSAKLVTAVRRALKNLR